MLANRGLQAVVLLTSCVKGVTPGGGSEAYRSPLEQLLCRGTVLICGNEVPWVGLLPELLGGINATQGVIGDVGDLARVGSFSHGGESLAG